MTDMEVTPKGRSFRGNEPDEVGKNGEDRGLLSWWERSSKKDQLLFSFFRGKELRSTN